MGKVSPVSAKYIIHTTINIEGVVEKPDVIGAIFGQTEGLLGSELELRELQRSGRIGRIEVNTDTKGGRTGGVITLPSSLDKAETSIVAAALEVIERIGPCNANIKVQKIEDVRVSKRSRVVERAKALLKNLVDHSMPDSQELADEVTFSVRVMEIQDFGKDRLAAGPGVDDGDEIIVVEGRADVVNLLKHGIKNGIAINGTSIPETVIELCKKKIVTAFVDGDRGGELIIKAMLMVAEIDYVTKAPDGKEVEELTKKELHQALRARVVPQQMRLDKHEKHDRRDRNERRDRPDPQREGRQNFQKRISTLQPPPRPMQHLQKQMSPGEKEIFKTLSEELIGSRAAYLLDSGLKILGKVPVSELSLTLKGLTNVSAVIFDGTADHEIVRAAEASGVKQMVSMDNRVKSNETRIVLGTIAEL